MLDTTWTWPAAGAAAAATFSAIAAWISATTAAGQRKLGEEKLKLDLFDRRYKVYEAVCRYIANAVRHGNSSDEALRDLDRGTVAIEFLFGQSLRDYVTLVRNSGIDLKAAHDIMEPLPVGAERSKQAQTIHDLCIWFSRQWKESEEVFALYLRFPVPGPRLPWRRRLVPWIKRRNEA